MTTLLDLQPTQRAALLCLAHHGPLHRTRDGYAPATGVHAPHSTRAMYALVRAGLAEWTDGESVIAATPAGHELVAECRDAAAGGRVERSLAA